MNGPYDVTATSFGGSQSLTLIPPGTDVIDALPAGSVARELFERPWKFDFFQAVMLLQDLAARSDSASAAPIAGFSLPREEAMRFSVPSNNVFPGAAIQAIQWDADQQRPNVCINFMGLTGPSGVLPRSYTEHVQRVELVPSHAERHALRDWLDNFNHRLASLFFQAWAKYRFPVSLCRPSREAATVKQPEHIVRVALASIAGIAIAEQPQPSLAADAPATLDAPVTSDAPEKLERDELLGLAGLLAQRPMNVCNLQSALQQSLEVPVRIKQFEGTWLPLDERTQTQLGNRNCRLGQDAVVGERLWSRQQKITIEVGPLPAEQFPQYLPPTDEHSGRGLQRLRHLVGICIGQTLEFDVQPVLRIDRPLSVQLTHDQTATRLGYDSWLGSPPEKSVAADAIFPGNARC
ncbi:type VI secretion system baseplate subunit TssG [Roseimaritima ulvae]|uniref:Type VI secretion system baseplate subunit TssG n=1 Tax=Roseimaritima ulvae TaxID=980254 RepID=A0A5B9QNQ3_9BACT|nr:type VI secretion system baseplate subunit TssG [Roseimaritima ulvae]QEG40604.1 hypothetical protein UC8_26200 [Roseimaritima ulvae]